MKRTLIPIILFLSLGCVPDKAPGEQCSVTGDGFTRRDLCAETCVNWEIECPNGSTVIPDVCSGELCTSADCDDGFECLQIDSFESNSRCMPVGVCN